MPAEEAALPNLLPHILDTACFSGLILNFKNTFPKIPNYCSELRFFILLLKNDIIPSHIYYVYTILSINIKKKIKI